MMLHDSGIYAMPPFHNSRNLSQEFGELWRAPTLEMEFFKLFSQAMSGFKVWSAQ